jgi:hypothetical protein
MISDMDGMSQIYGGVKQPTGLQQMLDPWENRQLFSKEAKNGQKCP